jgi:DNA-binding NarL/FixJ family response regulator
MEIGEDHGALPRSDQVESGVRAASEPVPTGSETHRRVVVVDDHELLRAGTRRILEEASGFSVVGEAEDGEAALRVIAEVRPDVVLIDIRLPTMNGIDLARHIVGDYPKTTVLILSAYDDENYVRAALAAGVAGYLLKTTPSERLVASIRAACDGFNMIEREPSGRGEKATAAAQGGASPHLTAREREVVRLAARGMANKAIARQLGISPRTVEGHLNHVFDKIGANSRTEVVHYALANSLFSRDQNMDADPGQ